MSGFVQRFSSDPGLAELIRIEGVDIIDRDPPANVIGTGSGTVCLVGEFENGPFNTPTEVLSPTDLFGTFGSFGYTYAGIGGKNPCARLRQADGALVSEFWNGNAFVQLVGKKFNRLLLCRADTSVGSVTFSRLADIVGASKFRFSLQTGQHLDFKHDGGASTPATFTGVAATVTGAAGTFNPLVGETATLGFDGQPNFTVLFDGTESTNLLCISRINQYAGFAFAVNAAGQIKLTGRQAGTGGQVRVVSGTAGTLAKLGLTAANTAGTGNVGDITAVTPTEVNSVVNAAQAGTFVDQKSDGSLRIYSSTTSTSTPGSIEVVNTTTAADFGFPIVAVTVNAGNAGTIPAGTVVRNSGSTVILVTMQDIAVTAASPGPYTVKVRHATDDLTGLTAIAGAIAVIDSTSPIDLDSYAVNNVQAISAALTDSQIDAQYATAISSTVNVSTVARQINLIASARQSNACRRNLKANATQASNNGCYGRMAFTRPPMNSAVSTVTSASAEPGVGAYRDQRHAYCYPGFNVTIPQIARLGVAGGTGFTADGNMDTGADVWLASVCSQLAPEENPGQATTFLDNVNSLETGSGNSANSNANVTGFDINTYKALRAAGIASTRNDGGAITFQSGITSVDPSQFPQLKNIARRRMADFIQDSLSIALAPHVKKLMTRARRRAIRSAVEDFLLDLKSPTNDNLQRIVDFAVSDKGNTPTAIAAGIYRLTIRVQTLPSLDVLVLDTTIGETVDVTLAA